ncbi:TetR-like C-terminal domain-containing protein [Dactylosporangium aurantiacum]|nr:TetR-like C-terminal domain-containing protein [Dactylosporangium aurantiacum]MDG6107695.1 TetR-like C-terminal domain-containing protein [Dactylosporangium aurantiacum]
MFRTAAPSGSGRPTHPLSEIVRVSCPRRPRQRHLYQLMFSNPPGDPTALARAAQRSQTEFLTVVADLVGEQDARRYAALLISSANGIAGLAASGQLTDPKWGGVSAEDLTDTLVDMIAGKRRHT